jgi:tRNA 2-thiouridine synthesizing protein A
MDVLDLTGMVCPMPVLRTKRALGRLAPGEELVVRTDDPHAVEDLAVFARQSGHALISQQPDDEKPGSVLHTLRVRGEKAV